MDNNRKLQIFLPLARRLNNNNISWILGGSMLLHLSGIDVIAEDIDIIVDQKHHNKLLDVLKDYTYNSSKHTKKYKTDYFYSVSLQEVIIDIMINFKMQRDQSIYHFTFKVSRAINFNDTTIYLSDINEWRNAYSVMGREQKVAIIDQHLHKKNVTPVE